MSVLRSGAGLTKTGDSCDRISADGGSPAYGPQHNIPVGYLSPANVALRIVSRSKFEDGARGEHPSTHLRHPLRGGGLGRRPSQVRLPFAPAHVCRLTKPQGGSKAAAVCVSGEPGGIPKDEVGNAVEHSIQRHSSASGGSDRRSLYGPAHFCGSNCSPSSDIPRGSRTFSARYLSSTGPSRPSLRSVTSGSRRRVIL